MADSWFQVHGADGTVLVGGLEGVERTEDNYFPPTIIGDVSPTNVLMQVPQTLVFASPWTDAVHL